VDPMVAMVIGAVLVVIIVVALVSMSKRTEDIPTHRSV
jgi:type II secretory pathway component PulJ